MNDLISRKAAIAEIDEYLQGLDLCISEPDIKLDGYRNGLQVAIHELKELPFVDAAPVVHGKWIEYGHNDNGAPKLACNVCSWLFVGLYPRNYCPNCNAKMDDA